MTKTTEQKVIKFIDENQLLSRGDKVLLALSGGADSVFLLSFLQKFKRRFGIEIKAFHLNHQLRGRAANQDEKFCADFCSHRDIKMLIVTRDVKAYAKKMKISLEEAGREIRYKELNKAAKKMNCSKIATAHNLSDNTETILLNLFKGTGLTGLTGIPVRRENIIRPILCLSSDEIRKYLKQNKMDYRIDKSNLSNDYERNFLRNEIIPKLKARLNPKLEEKISSSSNIFSQINSYITKQIQQVDKKVVIIDGESLRIDLKRISKLDKNFLNLMLKPIVENNFKIELNSENIFSLTDLIKSESGRSIQLKENIFALRERNELFIQKKKKERKRKSFVQIKIGQTVEIYGKLISIEEVNKKMVKFTRDKSIEFISDDGLKSTFEIRFWKAGDKFQPIGLKGTKKVSDYLADEKIASSEKKNKLVLNNNGKIVWLIGHRIDAEYKINSGSNRILKLTVSEK